jgi:hypothetical protein
MPSPAIEIDLTPALKAVAAAASPETVRTVVEAAGAEARKALIDHFRAREQEPENTSGFPKFGESFGKRGFWAGTRGGSVSEAVSALAYLPAEKAAFISIDSPALAHRADTNPPRITPKGGRRYLAIPANARAAQWQGMPKDFDVPGGMKFGYAPTADGRWMPALVALENHLRRATKGKRAGQRVKAAAGKGTSGVREPQFWLVRSVQTRHDPRAMPDPALLAARASARAASVLSRLTPSPNS